jgi:hypothetical protein
MTLEPFTGREKDCIVRVCRRVRSVFVVGRAASVRSSTRISASVAAARQFQTALVVRSGVPGETTMEMTWKALAFTPGQGVRVVLKAALEAARLLQ